MILRLAELSFPRIEALDRERTVVLFAVSPLEEHGPHLPVGTDLFHAEYFNEALAKRIIEAMPGWTAVIGPPIPIGASAFDKAGTLLVRPRTVRNTALDYGAALARHGFRFIIVTNGHGGPRHIVALEEAAAAVSRRYASRMLSVSGPILWNLLRGRFTGRLEPLLGRPLTDAELEALRGDAHGGLWETSLLMRVRPDLVDPAHRSLAPIRFPLIDALRYNYPLRLGNQLGYIGSPAAATPEFGEAAERLLLDILWEAVCPMFEAADDDWQQTSFWYRVPFMRTAFPYVALAAGLLLAVAALLWRLR
ncbi:MAG TPA: creatininase family protein [Terriglobia bacterium]|nr:creatininase family protein [Terriglobia bacterium]